MANERILIVDDEVGVVEYCSEALSAASYDVATATSGTQAVETARAEPFAVLLTDIKMPDMDGLDIFRTIREFDTDIAGIAMTGYASLDNAVQALHMGFTWFIAKPFAVDELTSAVECALERVQIARENARLKALIGLHELAEATGNQADLDALLAATLDTALKETAGEAASVALAGEAPGKLLRRLSVPPDHGRPDPVAAADEFMSTWVAHMGSGRVFVNDATEGPAVQGLMRAAGIGATICLPLTSAGEVLGTLTIHRYLGNGACRFSDADLRAASVICAHAAMAIRNAELQQHLQRHGDVAAIRSLATAVEARVPYAVGHSDRVSEYAALIAAKLELEHEETEVVRVAGALHNVGTVGIDEAVLLQPGPLSEQQWQEVKRHPVIGARIIEAAALPEAVRAAVYHHHERYDGHGYPEGLRGHEIPLAARILAVADTFAACTATRPHRPRMSAQGAMGVLTSAAGEQLDPHLVAVVVELVPELYAAADALSAQEALGDGETKPAAPA